MIDLADLIRGAELARVHLALTEALAAIYAGDWADYAAAAVHRMVNAGTS